MSELAQRWLAGCLLAVVVVVLLLVVTAVAIHHLWTPREILREITPARKVPSCPTCPKSSVRAKVGGRVSPDGMEEIAIDLPGRLHLHNTGGMGPQGPGSGSGLCVPTSANIAAFWQSVRPLQSFQTWCTDKPGGSDPEKFDRFVKSFCREQNVPLPRYVQITNPTLATLRTAIANGRHVCIVYRRSPTGRYNGQPVLHMVNLSHASDNWFAVLDNNFPGVDQYEWMRPEVFEEYVAPNWAIIFDAPGPPPVPRNLERSRKHSNVCREAARPGRVRGSVIA